MYIGIVLFIAFEHQLEHKEIAICIWTGWFIKLYNLNDIRIFKLLIIIINPYLVQYLLTFNSIDGCKTCNKFKYKYEIRDIYNLLKLRVCDQDINYSTYTHFTYYIQE